MKRFSVGALAAATSDEAYQLILTTVPKSKAPATLADFGYFYNSDGALRMIADPTKGFQWLGQKHYDALGNAIIESIYGMMQERYALRRVLLPLAPTPSTDDRPGGPRAESEPRSAVTRSPQIPIFVSQNADKADTLLLIMQGSGAVRPGMWARALCINGTLATGTIFSYLEQARTRGWGVIVTNPNENECVGDIFAASDKDGSATVEEFWLGTADAAWKQYVKACEAAAVSVPGSESPLDHSHYVYEHFVRTAAAKKIFAVAHSYGGRCVGSLLRDDAANSADLLHRCRGIAFTDAINDGSKKEAADVIDFYRHRVINWIASPLPLDARCPSHKATGSSEVSSGDNTHEGTSASCLPSVFRWFDALAGKD